MYEDRLPTEPVFSAKAIVTGGLASLCIAIGSPYGNMVIRGSYHGGGFIPLFPADRFF